ncbi:MAG TPA: methylenetetrahydrofolate reductase C-terminal domain-containing protein [Syntrophorhabdaceae bacterium]|nr:methylenetetrahydrofolate reductase C-terminal domain-containing protein [Syntrophorhabdaceae bacterium]HQM80542.1 methylenetetrahydrofolate reductase C-terminal domain-containing protein [Syntrophorhabdaceae bacterium]
MITAERKPMAEIRAMLAPYRKILVVGCGSCVAECASGGEKEVGLLASALRMDAKIEGRTIEVREMTIDRQCVYEFIDQLTGIADRYEIILSLGCGAGVQAVAEVFPKMLVIPALNTTFIGETKEPGLWVENCRACGDCKLGYFAAVCPVTRCAKGLFNGPCGGSKNGVCEVDPDSPCAWQLIIERLENAGRSDLLEAIYPPADWSRQQGKGPKKIVREDQRSEG